MQQRLNRSRYRLGELTHVCPRNKLTTGCTWQKRLEDLRGGVDAGRRYQYGSNLLTTTGRCVCRIAVAGRRDAITTSTITCHSISRRRRRRGRISRTSASRATRRSRTRATCSDTSARRTPSAPPPAGPTRAPTAARQDCRAISRKLARLSRVLVLFFSHPRSEGWPHTMDVLSPFIPVLCHSD